MRLYVQTPIVRVGRHQPEYLQNVNRAFFTMVALLGTVTIVRVGRHQPEYLQNVVALFEEGEEAGSLSLKGVVRSLKETQGVGLGAWVSLHAGENGSPYSSLGTC